MPESRSRPELPFLSGLWLGFLVSAATVGLIILTSPANTPASVLAKFKASSGQDHVLLGDLRYGLTAEGESVRLGGEELRIERAR